MKDNQYTERNIQMLLHQSFNKELLPDESKKEEMLRLLTQKVEAKTTAPQPNNYFIIGSTLIWIALIGVVATGACFTMSIPVVIQLALGISLLSIPVSCIVLIISKSKDYEKKFF